jgi:hypothetical protein
MKRVTHDDEELRWEGYFLCKSVRELKSEQVIRTGLLLHSIKCSESHKYLSVQFLVANNLDLFKLIL